VRDFGESVRCGRGGGSRGGRGHQAEGREQCRGAGGEGGGSRSRGTGTTHVRPPKSPGACPDSR
jgi:hypothetical protein